MSLIPMTICRIRPQAKFATRDQHTTRIVRRLRIPVIAFALVAWSAMFVSAADPVEPSAKPAPAKSPATASEVVTQFLTQYCIDCHGPDAAEGERRFDSFTLPIDSEPGLITADEIVDQVTLKLMPPEDAEQPTDEERLKLLDSLRAEIDLASEHITPARAATVMRRLSNREYENTLATLLDRRVDTLGLTADFPKENTSHHMDNIGEALVTSGFLLDQYFQAASRLVETRLARPDVPTQKWHFTDNFKQYEELTGSHRSVFNFEYLCLYEQPDTDTRQGGFGHIEDFLQGVPVSGLYDIAVEAQAMHRDTHYDPKIFRIDFSEPFELAVVPGDVTRGHIHYPQAIQPILGRTLVPDDQPEWLEFRVWLEAGQTPRFIFPNGPFESRASVIEVNKRYSSEFSKPASGVSRSQILREGALPHIRIGQVKIEGPIAEPGGTREEKAVFGEQGFQPDQATEQLLAFAEKAFRRPLEPADRDRVETFYQSRLSQDATPRRAALDTVTMILCSPSFLYFSEVTDEGETRLRPYDLATRLSYALWSAPPDEALRESAASGRISETDEILSQVNRMLDDDRSDAFISGFLDGWLNLRDIGNLPPPRKAAPAYYAENLPESMKQETRLWFKHLLQSDGPVTDFLDSDYTFVDKKLAKLYGLPEQETMRLADGFQKVSLADQPQRGGILGTAAVLTVSANGVDTSPVTRGVWVLENVLGIIPPPPPDEVPSIDGDISGATTIREKLAKHSADPACNVCHRNIDPLGFALETFDPIGRWRTKYPQPAGDKNNKDKDKKNKDGDDKQAGPPKIDPSGKLPSGETFANFASFKKVLVEHRRDRFTRNLIEKLLSYATGRHMQRVDQAEIDRIVKTVEANEYGLRTMINEVFTSEIFRSR